jgi:hypothetical protein
VHQLSHHVRNAARKGRGAARERCYRGIAGATGDRGAEKIHSHSWVVTGSLVVARPCKAEQRAGTARKADTTRAFRSPQHDGIQRAICNVIAGEASRGMTAHVQLVGRHVSKLHAKSSAWRHATFGLGIEEPPT